MDFGYEIPYDELLKTIETADARIKLAVLYEPEIETKACLVSEDKAADDTLTFLPDELPIQQDGADTDWFKFIVAKNALAGRIDVFDYATDFKIDYNEKAIDDATPIFPCEEKERVGLYTSYADIPEFSASATEYELKDNEAIQFISDSLVTKQTYAFGIYYFLQLVNDKNFIPANAEYCLQDGETAIFVWTDENGQQQEIPYKKGDILKPNMD